MGGGQLNKSPCKTFEIEKYKQKTIVKQKLNKRNTNKRNTVTNKKENLKLKI